MTKENIKTNIFYCGEGPTDLAAKCEQELLLDDNNKVYIMVGICPYPFDSEFYGVSDHSLLELEDFDDSDLLEYYESIKETKESKYYKNFKNLKKIALNDIDDYIKRIDDSKYYEEGRRVGFNISPLRFIGEQTVGNLNDKDQFLYVQYQRTDGVEKYTITKTSIYMRMYLGEVYEYEFGRKDDVEIIFESNNIKDLGNFEFLREAFNVLVTEVIKQEAEVKVKYKL